MTTAGVEDGAKRTIDRHPVTGLSDQVKKEPNAEPKHRS
jgi:hypothetical protein